ncbi:MAG: hypothetical protein KIT57_17580 [Blastocatellales bacterium]|nr:hypothetical protein [Blastocatellales bacterium]
MLTPYRVVARNYATRHANRIHSEDTARLYGFSGGLVPGVALYAYITDPLPDALGREWLERGRAQVKFLKPVYDADEVEVHVHAIEDRHPRAGIELFDSSGALCAVGEAAIARESGAVKAFDPAAWPYSKRTENDVQRPASIAAVAPGDTFWSWEFTADFGPTQQVFMEEIGSAPRIYSGAGAVLHPARLLAQANEIVAHNIALGPWIHTGSEVQHAALADDGERLTLRGRVAEACEKRGHDFITLDLALTGRSDRLIALIRHSALIRLREREAGGNA